MTGEGHSIERACRIVGVSTNGLFQRRIRPPSERSIRHAWLLDQIKEIHSASRGTYGARRVHAELTIGQGVKIGHGDVDTIGLCLYRHMHSKRSPLSPKHFLASAY